MYVHTHTHTHTYIYTYIQTHTYIHTHIHIYIHTNIHTYIHTRDGGNQTVDRPLYDCTKLQWKRERLISNVLKQDNWTVGKSDLVNKYINNFIQFTNSMEKNFKKL